METAIEASLNDLRDSGQGPDGTELRNGKSTKEGRGKSREEEDENMPGYAWLNAKAQDERARAMDMIADKGFNLRE